MKYLNLRGTFWILLFFILSCSNSNDAAPNVVITVENLEAKDAENSGNASDILVSFSKPSDINSVSAFRVIFVKESSGNIDVATASDIGQGSYYEILSSEPSENVALPANLNDLDGDPVAEGVAYRLSVLSIGIDVEDALSTSSTTITLAQTNLVKTLAANVNGGSGGMAIDTEGNVYMADFGLTLGGPPGDKIFKISPSGDVSIFATGFVGASGNDFDSNGNLFQSNIQGQSISKVTPDGTVSTFASGSPIVGTVGISIDENDELFVADCSGNNLLKVDKNGAITVFATSSLFNCPNGLTRDDSGNLYAANFSDGNVLKITPAGDVSVLATLPGGNNGHLVFHDGLLYVIARTAGQIYKVTLTGGTELFAGSGERGSEDGAALDATFSLPNDLIFSNDGTKIYINDVVPTTGNNIAPCNIRVLEIVEN